MATADAGFTQELSPELLQAHAAVLEKLSRIEAGLKVHDPLVAHHCKNIRDTLMEHEELVHLLKDEQVRVLMAGMKSYINVQLVKETSKSRGKGKITSDDL